MAISDAKRRELLCVLAFSQSFYESDPSTLLGILMETLAVTRKNVYEAAESWRQIEQLLPQLQERLSAISRSYSLERIGAVERAILFVAAEEILAQRNDPRWIISDAIRIARKYATPEAGAIINALLDGLTKQMQGESVDEQSIQQSLAAAEAAEEVAGKAHESQVPPECSSS